MASEGILTEYLSCAMGRAAYEHLDDGTWHAEIPACDGIWATGASQTAAEDELQQVLEEWVLIRLQRGQGLPPVDGVSVEAVVPEAAGPRKDEGA